MTRLKNAIDLDVATADRVRFDADTVGELKELVSKLTGSKAMVSALEQNDLSGMVAFLETFESASAERKFILHHVTKALDEEKPETLLLRWAMVYMLRTSNISPEHLHHELLNLLPAKAH